MSLWKEWRIWLLVLVVLGSLVAIAPNPWAKGVYVKYVEKNSPVYGEITTGEIINSINEKPIQKSGDLMEFENYTGMMRIFHNGQLTLKEVNGNLGLEVGDVSFSNLNLGMDLVGGTRIILKPVFEEGLNESEKAVMAERVISTLQTRMNVYGLKEIIFQSVSDVEGNRYVQIEMAGASKKEIEDLLSRQGNFESYITRIVDFVNGTGSMEIGDKNYTFGLAERTSGNATEKVIVFEGKDLAINQTVELNDIEFKLWNVTDVKIGNVTEEKAIFAGKTFVSEDIKYVYFDPEHSFVRRYGDGWEFSFQILVSDEGAQRFANITEDIPVLIDAKTGESYLSESIYLFLDDVPMDSLRISASMAGQAYSTPQITGGGTTEENAETGQRRLQSILSSGALPVGLETIRADSVSPSLGSQFMKNVLIALLAAMVAVSAVILIRYKNWKITLLILMTSLSEMVIVLGVASLIHWTIDLAAIAGIIASVGTGVDDQIIITDEISRSKEERVFSLKEKIKRAFFIIFGAASTVIAAMIPLGIIGIGVMRGFAITTIIGILGGIFITRPAYSKIIEKLELV